ncbi:unnamed protein product [Schistosoma curassoni]|uniref:Ras-associating domain-containing protein n=1 Tax=Schistosoma curassoni TaxID=6186 RepID=A0A183JTT6_9TREM|nr:unnamed protein product [Schistosoma curassoni]
MLSIDCCYKITIIHITDENPLIDILCYNFAILFFNPLLEYLCVFDGVGALKRRSCRSFSFSKSMSTYSAVKRFLKTFHLAGTPDYYNVYEVNEHGMLSPFCSERNLHFFIFLVIFCFLCYICPVDNFQI